jgi:DNA-binding transcriptional MocR family regulator
MTLQLGEHEVRLSDDEVKGALQYSQTPGMPQLLSQIQGLQQAVHGREQDGTWRTSVTTGSQDGLGKVMEALITENTPILVEEYTYSGTLACLDALGAQYVPIRVDEDGMDVDHLSRVLDGWEEGSMGPKPRVLYTIPTGSNPTGATMPNDRRARLYALAVEHDLLLLEDDPYYYMDLDWTPGGGRPVSLFRMDGGDNGGRVVRFDSFSKLISSGMRIGCVSGPPAVMDRVDLHSQSSCMHVSGVSQALLSAVFKGWGVGAGEVPQVGPGFEAHLDHVTSFYRSQRDAFVEHAQGILGDAVEFGVPGAGMFAWMRLSGEGVGDTTELISDKGVAANVIMLPGRVFRPSLTPPVLPEDDPHSTDTQRAMFDHLSAAGLPGSWDTWRDTAFVRASYSVASPADMGEALRRFKGIL